MTEKTIRPGDFGFESDVWPGLSKLVEEAGEVLTICGKFMGTGGDPEYWDGRNLREELTKEFGDLIAAMEFVIKFNKLDGHAIRQRMLEKLVKFEQWREKERP